MSVKRIISLMNEKSHYLEKFFAINEKELKLFLVDQFDGLDYFYESREKILEIIKYIDSQIEVASQEVTEMTAAEKALIKKAMNTKDRYVDEILRQDLQVLSCIESAKNGIIKELQTLKKSKKAVGGYKVPSFIKRLNEEV
jgi:hypothetical protein